MKGRKKKIVVLKWVSIAFPVHSSPVLRVVLFARARNGHGRAHWLDGIEDFGETIPD